MTRIRKFCLQLDFKLEVHIRLSPPQCISHVLYLDSQAGLFVLGQLSEFE